MYPLVGGVAAVSTVSYYDSKDYYTMTDPDGNNVTYHYDGLGRINQTAYYNGSRIYTTNNYTYTWLAQPTSVTGSSGVTQYSYDSLVRLYAVTNPDRTNITTTYNIPFSNYTITDENGHPTEYIDDLDGRIVSVRRYNASSSYYMTNYTYDQIGNLLTVKDANGEVTTYKYDDLNRLSLSSYPDGTNQSMTYDGVDNILSATTPNGSTISYSVPMSWIVYPMSLIPEVRLLSTSTMVITIGYR